MATPRSKPRSGAIFATVGKLELARLKSLGLSPGQFVIDVGCGSGRLAFQLAGLPNIAYLGTAVVADLLKHARKVSAIPDWRFVQTNGVAVPC